MGSCFPQDRLTGMVLEKHLSVKAASEHFGYNGQYLLHLLRGGRVEGVKIGQVWLIELASPERHLRRGQTVKDRRHGLRGPTADGRKVTT